MIRCPRTPAASARLEQSAALPALLARRLTMPVPVVKGWVALPEGGRAAVHAYLTGRAIDLASIAPGSPRPSGWVARWPTCTTSTDASTRRPESPSTRRRPTAPGARPSWTGPPPRDASRRVCSPAGSTPSRTSRCGASPPRPRMAASGRRRSRPPPTTARTLTSSHCSAGSRPRVADPADDLAALVGELHPDSLDTVLEAYAHARSDRPDQHLQERARLVHQMQLVRTMMSAVAAGDDDGAEEHARQLRRLDDQLAREDEEARSGGQARRAARCSRGELRHPARGWR
uniref:Uncharacterized protein n=1 Tax=Janibacter limosus TaxID=53458 RepID=A0AC61U6D8_9MICO|nr:hypothetical protein [Janibacter limosus]